MNLSVVPLLVPVSALVVAGWASQRGFGVLPALGAPGLVVLAATVLALDLWSYALHGLFHAVPPLWRLHRVHHADLDVDFSTGLRQHPVAVLLTAAGRDPGDAHRARDVPERARRRASCAGRSGWRWWTPSDGCESRRSPSRGTSRAFLSSLG